MKTSEDGFLLKLEPENCKKQNEIFEIGSIKLYLSTAKSSKCLSQEALMIWKVTHVIRTEKSRLFQC